MVAYKVNFQPLIILNTRFGNVCETAAVTSQIRMATHSLSFTSAFRVSSLAKRVDTV